MTHSASDPVRAAGPAPGTLSVARAVLYATLAVGLLDATDGVVVRGFQGQNPIQVLQYIASSVLGARAYADGLAGAGLGLVLHFAVSLVVATIYILASRRIAMLRVHWVAFGLLYGLAVWAVMNLVLLPLTPAGQQAIPAAAWVNGLLGHALFVGLPCAFFARKTQSA